MPKFEKLTLPSEGEIITFNQGKPNVPNNPIVPFIRGDGTGVDSWPATQIVLCLLYTSPSPRDITPSRMPSSA